MARRPPRPPPPPEASARERIVETAGRLFYRRGFHATSVDDVLAASKTGKSQLYHYFQNKDALVAEVVAWRHRWLTERQLPWEGQLDRWEGIEQWLFGWVRLLERDGCQGACPVGQLVSEAGQDDDAVREAVASVYGEWRGKLAAGLKALQARGELSKQADPEALADFAISAVQGGTLLAKAGRDIAPLKRTVAQVMVALKAFVPPRKK